MKEQAHQDHKCPLHAVEQRLADAHKLWHTAEQAYFDPDSFRLALQNTIQALRTVTFILQKNKGNIAKFDGWYNGWQARMREDTLLKWIIASRNKIEKEGDLELHSFVRAEIIASYLETGGWTEIPAELFDGPQKLVASIPDTPLGNHIKRNGVIRIQRRWVENNLPDYELLDALAIAYGKLNELVHDAHLHMGLKHDSTIRDDEGQAFDLASMGWRYPCMIGQERPRAITLSLADASHIEFQAKSIAVTREDIPRLEKLYKHDTLNILKTDFKTYDELAAGFFEVARNLFLKDGHHINILIFFKNCKPVRIHEIRVDSVQQKYMIMRELADEIPKSGADAAIMVGEVWTAPADQLKPYERPKDSPIRTELLTLAMVRKNGSPFACCAKIARNRKTVSLGVTEVGESMALFEFAPFYRAWGNPIPESWTKIDLMISEAAKKET